MEDALNWLRSQGSGSPEDNDPSGVFNKLDSTLPRKKGQSMEDRAKDIEGALNWMRQQGLDLADPDDDVLAAGTVGFKSMLPGSAVSRQSDMDRALNWLRSHDSVADDALIDPAGVFKKLDGTLPKKKGHSDEDRATDMVNALAWMREKGLVPESFDEPTPFQMVENIPMSTRSAEQRATDLKDALNWLRHKGEDDAKHHLLPCGATNRPQGCTQLVAPQERR